MKGIVVLVLSLMVLMVKGGTAQDTLWSRKYGPGPWGYGVAADHSANVISGGFYLDLTNSFKCQIVKYSPTGVQLWSKQASYGAGNLYSFYGVATDANDTIYAGGVAGSYTGAYYFLLVKYKPNGDTVWTRRLNNGPSNIDEVVVDPFGNIVVGGPVNILGVAYFQTVKYRPRGDTLWSRLYNPAGSGIASLTGVACDNSANIVVTGFYESDFLTVKYRPNGDTAWSRRFDSGGSDTSWGCTTDRAGNIVVTGNSDPGGRIVTVKYDSTGSLLWVRYYGGAGIVQAYDAACDSSNDIFVGGTAGTPNIAGVGDTALLIKYKPNGDTVWSYRYTCSGLEDAFQGVAVDPFNNVVCAGGEQLPSGGREYMLTFKFRAQPSGGEEYQQVSDQKIGDGVKARPNPFVSFATVPGHEAEHFSLYDVSGRRVGTCRGDRIGEGLAPGVYFLKTEAEDAEPVRIVKLR